MPWVNRRGSIFSPRSPIHSRRKHMQFCKNKLVAAVLLLLASFLPALAQTNTTSLTGDVQDATGAAITGGTVVLTNPATGLTKTTQSGEAGQFSFNQIPPGQYTVTIKSPGFGEQVLT